MLWLIWFRLCSLAVMAQAAVSDGQFLDRLPGVEDGLAAAEVDVSGGQVAEALVVAAVVVVVDESGNGGLELAGQEVVFQQDAVLQGLMPALDLALGLRVVRCAMDVGDALPSLTSRRYSRGAPLAGIDESISRLGRLLSLDQWAIRPLRRDRLADS